MARIEDILSLERIERDMFRGCTIASKLPRTFGGQVAGQALVSAVRTVEDNYRVHSLHGYFLRPGDPHQPAVYSVDRIRDGRSFTTRRVTGVQNGVAIFTMSASFHVGDNGISHQDTMPVVTEPDFLPDPKTLSEYGDSLYEEWKEWDIRVVQPAGSEDRPPLPARQQVWFRYRDELADEHELHVSALTYMSDMLLLRAAIAPHPGVAVQAASLDHALWFLRPFRADEWLLYDQTSPSADGGRALAQGQIFDSRGRLVAAVVQEGLTRIHSSPTAIVPAGRFAIRN
ncbi:acyl-CoA thioesterase [Rhodococcus sp. NPDC127530]|uniref:acyl-CoA thioesterase n=1 Tax=unclassified Rhodococcus (in: high G+C Gram-positive bacteria) TaxID=192944 RepID=UPI003642CC29